MTPDSVPTRKVTAGAIGGAASIIVVWMIGVLGLEVPAEVASAFTTVISFGLGYMVEEPE